ncbi:ABC transporter ATP-binding protein [Aureimonas sp. OT7]|uniref:ABC transporter ATP-binding protein n=1 Tax=Aureimonas sp. OT7 TaxID=2816454 RepID=UPI00177D9113|nr:ABC transporter ATP-binding protein [Aureimonas sp. OT7]QOG07278.1 ABC transporter ATP-binding protein [Aureimonas sp. OT7]
MSQSIVLRNVSKSFDKFQALRDINLHIEEGEFVALVGKSGCGKSTLLRIIAGLMEPTEGEVQVAGKLVTGPSDGIGMAFQTPVLLPWRTVEENIRLQLEVRRIDRPDLDRELARLLDLTGLKGFEKHRPYELSGGMQQRVALCRALIHDPSLLLLDEPFGALDAMTREQLNAEIQRVWMETGKTIVLVTHSIIEAVYLADRVVVMDSRPGRVTEIVEVKVARPRSFSRLNDPAFQEASDRIRRLMDAEGMTA